MKISETIRRAADNIETILKENAVPIPNPHAVSQIKFIANQLSGVANYAAEKAYNIASLADDFYSSRKHGKYRGGTDEVYSRIRHDLLSRMRSCASSYEHSENSNI